MRCPLSREVLANLGTTLSTVSRGIGGERICRQIVPFVLLVTVMLLAAAALPAFAQSKARGGPPPVPVEVGKAFVESIGATLSLSGTVVPHKRINVASELSGIAEEVFIEEGMAVSKDDLLVQLSRRTMSIEVEGAKASLEEARADLARLKAGSRPEEIEEKRAEVRAQRSLLEGEKRNYERLRSLYDEGVVNFREFDAARVAFENAAALVEVAEAKLSLTLAGSRVEDIRAAEARVRKREVALRRLQEDLRKTSIRAPAGGLVAKKLVEEGEWINAGSPVAEILAMDQVYVLVNVIEKDLSRIRENSPVRIAVDAYPGETFEGRVFAVLPEANRASRTFPVKVLVDNPEYRLKSGMFARAELTTETAPNALMVPKDAVINQGGRRVIFVVKDSVAHIVPVETGLSNRRFVQVIGDVRPEDLVVVTGQEGLRDQAAVKVNQIVDIREVLR